MALHFFCSQKNQKTAFTLLEFLIVIGVIAILSAAIIIGVRDATQTARETAALVFSNTIHKTLITNMAGEWTFDDESNPGYDSSGKGNSGILQGDPVWIEDGKVRGALNFDGDGDHIGCGNNQTLDMTNEITIEAWVKKTVLDQISNLVIKNNSYMLMVDDGLNKPYTSLMTEIGWQDCGHFNLEVFTGQWTHIAITYKSLGSGVYGQYSGYYNGQLDNTANSTFQGAIIPNGNDLQISGVNHFNGAIDEVRIYDAALEASQIKARYTEGLQKLYANGKLDGKEYYQRLTETGF